jgi:hypothetical protein
MNTSELQGVSNNEVKKKKGYSFGSLINPTMVCVEKRATSPPPFFGIG